MRKKLDKILTEAKPATFIYDLVGFVTNPDLGGVTKDHLRGAPPLVAGVVFVNAFDLATSNSGIVEWLIETYDDFPALDDFFDTIDAKRATLYLRSAYALFPKGRVFRNQDKRYAFCDKNEDQFRRLDQGFKGASEEAVSKLRDYVASNRETFEAQVEEFWELRKRHVAR